MVNALRTEGIDAMAAAARSLDGALLREPAEHALADALLSAQADNAPRFDGAFAMRGYTGALAKPQLQALIGAFFDGVMVMADDPPSAPTASGGSRASRHASMR